MLPLPAGLNEQFQAVLDRKGVARNKGFHYLKWLRYYLDFCAKYGFDKLHPATLPHFLDKLRQKNQTEAQQKQASETISWFYEWMSASDRVAEPSPPGPQQVPAELKQEKKTYDAGTASPKSSSTPDGRETPAATASTEPAAA